jgi:D-alanyl-lipoteichoic acid acyltransferase DltB (MBOAT superfamily)
MFTILFFVDPVFCFLFSHFFFLCYTITLCAFDFAQKKKKKKTKPKRLMNCKLLFTIIKNYNTKIEQQQQQQHQEEEEHNNI